tara:strand:+ start:1338 stop:2954 length:1617 start_codon:yes stop_codon:yes gene_type:complete
MDHACWRFIMKISRKFFKDYAHRAYLNGLQETGITTDYIPVISEMDDKLQKIGWRAVPVRGFLPPTIFMQFQAHSILPIASDMRTVSHIDYTPAPDIIHEAAGHSPIIVDEKYSQFLKEYGVCAANALSSDEDHQVYLAIRNLSDLKENPQATSNQIKEAEEYLSSCIDKITFISEAAYLARLNWWTVEYGLVGEIENPKIYGAGLLSSISESYNAIFKNVKKIPLSIDCINFSYDITEQQPQLFVAKNFEHLIEVLNQFKGKMAFTNGGLKSVKEAIKCKSVTTFTLDSGIQISGIPNSILHDDKINFYVFNGPVQLSYKNNQLKGHGPEYHSEGYSSPLVNEKIIHYLYNKSLDEKVNLNFDGGIKFSGKIKDKTVIDDTLLLVSFTDCLINHNENILFDPSWGEFDLACGSHIDSVSGGPADINNFLDFMDVELPNKLKPNHLKEHSKKYKNIIEYYSRVEELRTCENVSDKEITLLFNSILKHYPEEWLLLFDLLDIAKLNNYKDLYSQIKSKILLSTNNQNITSIIKRSISQL